MLDGAIAILCGVGGVEPQSETVWRQADKYRVPRIVFINKMDRIGADPERAVLMLRTRVAAKPLPIQIPLGREDGFRGVIDLIDRKVYDWGQDLLGTDYVVREVAEEDREEVETETTGHAGNAERTRRRPDAEVPRRRRGLRAGAAERRPPGDPGPGGRPRPLRGLLPEQGRPAAPRRHRRLPAVARPTSGRSSGHHPKTQAEEIRPASDDAPFSGLVFKIANDPFLGNLAYFRVYSGKAKIGQAVYNSTKDEEEKLSRLLEMHSNKRKEIKEVFAGDIAAMGSTKNISTGDTLCLKSHPIVLESIRFPEPVIAATIEPKTKADHPKLATTLAKLAREDPTLKVTQDPMTGQTLLRGMGELHLEIIMDRMEREFGVRANLGKPQVAYKETIQAAAEGEGKYIRQAGGKGLYGHCVLRLEPLDRGRGFEFVDRTRGGVIPREFVGDVENGVREALEAGVVAGFPVTDFRAALVGGSTHDTDATPVAYKIAATLAFREAAKKAGPVLLEPLMKLEIVAPDDYLGDIVGDINARRGKIEGMEMRSGSPRHHDPCPPGRDVRLRDDAPDPDPGPRRLRHGIRQVRTDAPGRPGRDRRPGRGPRALPGRRLRWS